uniref:Uncharacterized protein n=1 Tax=Setaria italica TaxID=4555 RepID=K4A3S8_SETIT
MCWEYRCCAIVWWRQVDVKFEQVESDQNSKGHRCEHSEYLV